MEKSRPYWLLPNLMSLDAPIVAVVWAWIFAETWRVQWINDNIFYILPGIVWIIYVLDRILDNQASKGVRAKVSSRHAFHAEHWGWMKYAVFTVAGSCIALGFQLPKGIFVHALPVLGLVSVYFFFALINGGNNERPVLFKNIIAGYTFSYGVALGIYFFRPSTFWLSLIWSREMLMFSALCICNITAIDIWEASRATRHREEKSSYELTLTIPLLIITVLCLYLAVKGDEYARPFYFVIMVSAGLLQLINRYRSRFSLDALRALADGALIAPAPIFWAYLQYLK